MGSVPGCGACKGQLIDVSFPRSLPLYLKSISMSSGEDFFKKRKCGALSSENIQTWPMHINTHKPSPVCTHTHTAQASCHFVCLDGFFFNALAGSPSIANIKDDCLAWFSTRVSMPHKGHLAMPKDIFGCHNLGRGFPLASGG